MKCECSDSVCNISVDGNCHVMRAKMLFGVFVLEQLACASRANLVIVQ